MIPTQTHTGAATKCLAQVAQGIHHKLLSFGKSTVQAQSARSWVFGTDSAYNRER